MTTTLQLRRTATAFALALSIGAVAPSVIPAGAQAQVRSVGAGLGASHDAFCADMADQINHAAGVGDALALEGKTGADSWWEYARQLQSVAEAGGCRFTGVARPQTVTGSRQLSAAPTNPTLAAKAAVTQTERVYGLAG